MKSFEAALDRSIASPQATSRSNYPQLDMDPGQPAFSMDHLRRGATLPAQIAGGGLHVATEAIVVLDIVQSTCSTSLYGWNAVGRVVSRELRRLTGEACAKVGLTSMKTTGDGLLLTFSNRLSAELAVPTAIASMRALLAKVRERNAQAPQHLRFDVRVGIHFGEVDIIDDDREGPNIAFAFRLERVSKTSLASALNPIDSCSFPTANYMICSEAVAEVLDRVGETDPRMFCGLFKMKGFPGWREVFLLETASAFGATAN